MIIQPPELRWGKRADMVGLKAGTYTPCRCDLEQLATLGEECGLRAGFLKGWVWRERSGAELEVPDKQTTN